LLKFLTDDLREKLKALVINKLKDAETAKAQDLLDNKENHPNFLLIVYLRSLNQNLLDQATADKVNDRLTELENKENIPPKQEKRKTPSPEEDKQNDNPSPKRRKNEPEDKDQLIRDLEKNIAKLQEEVRKLKSESKKQNNQQKFEEVKKEIEKTKEKINNSNLDESKKQELLNLLEEITTKTTTNEVEISPSTPLHY